LGGRPDAPLTIYTGTHVFDAREKKETTFLLPKKKTKGPAIKSP